VCHLPSSAPPGPARVSATSRALSSADRRRTAAANSSTASFLSLPLDQPRQARVRGEGLVGQASTRSLGRFIGPVLGRRGGAAAKIGLGISRDSLPVVNRWAGWAGPVRG
jgi:hypothetical protein